MEQVTDDDLIRLYRNGDAEAFDTLFDRYHTPVYNFARTMLGNHRGPEEVLQETFLAVARSAKDYIPRGRFRAWLMRIVRNRCLNHLQARRVRRVVLGGSEARADQAASHEPSPPNRAAANERTAAIRNAVAKLPDRQREAIALYAFEQLTYQQIADVMELPINTVKTHIHRARVALAAALGDLRQE